MRKKPFLFSQTRTIMIASLMFISGLIFVCYMGSSLIRTTKKYQENTLYVAHTLDSYSDNKD